MGGSGTDGACSSPTGRTSGCRTRRRTRRSTRSRWSSSRGSASPWPGSPCCSRWRPAACHDLAIAPYAGKGTGETTLLRRMYDSLCPGDVVLADALFDNYFLACELRQIGVELVARVQAERVESRKVASRPDGDVIPWQRPNKPRGMTGGQYRRYPKRMLMRQVAVDAHDKNNRAERFKVVTTILDASIDGGQIGDLYDRRWEGEVDIRSIKAVM